MIDVNIKMPDGSMTRVRKVSPVPTKRGAHLALSLERLEGAHEAELLVEQLRERGVVGRDHGDPLTRALHGAQAGNGDGLRGRSGPLGLGHGGLLASVAAGAIPGPRFHLVLPER